MSTEIKSTLFRFVTMRAPEFVEQSEVNKNHVVFPSDLENNNIFISAVRNLLTTGDREAALKDIIKNFVPIKNREQLIDIEGNVNLYEFSIWLTKNRNALKKDEILDYINNIGVSPLSNIEEIWNNLFYQILTSESNYVRDGLLSLLVGHNFITNHLNIPQTDKDFKKLAQAKVIVPKELFVKANMTNAVNDKNNIINGLPKSTTHLEKKLEVVVQKQYLENLNSTLDELKLYQNKLNRKASKQFEIDKKAYDENIKTLTENTTPNRQTFTDKEIGVDRTFTDFDNLKLPNFEPTLYPELDITDIENNVSNQTFIIADAVINSSEPNTLTELNQTIAQEISQTTSTIFNNTIAQQSNVQMINGVIIPENTDIEGDTLLFYADNFAGNPFNNLMAVFNTNIDNAQVVQASYKIKIGTAAFQNFTESNGLINFSIDNNKLTVKFNPTGLILTLNSTITINGTLTISNGDQILFNAIGVVKTKAGNRFLNLTLNAVGTFSTTKASI